MFTHDSELNNLTIFRHTFWEFWKHHSEEIRDEFPCEDTADQKLSTENIWY